MTNSLTIFTRAAAMLAEADTIQKTKELKDLALTAADFARRKGMGEEAIAHCRSYALEAERKMGAMLAATERAKGVRVVGGKPGKTGGNVVLPPAQPPKLAELGLSKRESSMAQALAALPNATFEEVKAGTKTRRGKPAHVSRNSGENEWYTPVEFVEAARKAMGGIDCDPASSEKANQTVKAKRFFSKKEDGLKQEWSGRVFLNPPYARPLIEQFAFATEAKFSHGEIKQACVLVNNATETAWFVKLAEVASAICFPSSRIRFLDPDGKPGAPLQGQSIFYIGERHKEFCQEFRGFGLICRVIH